MPRILQKLAGVFKVFSKKRALFGFLICLVLGLLSPFYLTSADGGLSIAAVLGGIIGSLGGTVAAYLVTAFGLSVFFLGLSTVLLHFGHNILSWAITSPFQLAMTNPNGNIVIELGWTLMRDFTNMLFILGLAYIGIATALDIAGFDTKKAFINLLLIALLINFTPIVCGIIVDISNIITNFFLEDVDFGEMLSVLKNNFAMDMGITGALQLFKSAKFWAQLGISLVYTFVAGLTLLTFGLLFLLRHIAIWILVILSPLAFFAWIFEKSRPWFKKWWKNFLMWSFIGVPASFFLYLAYHLLQQSEKAFSYGMLDASDGLFEALVPHFIVTAFLIAGFMATKKFTPIGASAVIGWVGKVQGAATGTAKQYRKKLGKWSRGIGAGATVGAGAGFAAGQGAKGRMAGALKGITTPEGRELGREKTALGLEALHLSKPGSYRKRVAKEMGYPDMRKAIEEYSLDELKKSANQKTFGKRGMAEKGLAIEKLIKEDNFDFTGDQAREKIEYMQKSHKGLKIHQLLKSRPDLAADVEKGKVKKLIDAGAHKDTARYRIIQERVQKINVEDFEKKSKIESYDEFAFLSGLDKQKIKYIEEKGSTATRDKLKNTVDGSKYQQAMIDAQLRGDKDTADNLSKVKQWVETIL